MKKYILLSILLTLTNLYSIAQDCPGLIQITTQEGVDNFAATYPCTTFSGGILIKEDIPGTITNLNGLSQITHVNSNLMIMENDSLKNLSGLDNIQTIDRLEIHDNPAVTSLEGLGSLDSVSYFSIKKMHGLTDLSGLSGAMVLDSVLRISQNDALLSIEDIGIVSTVLSGGIGIGGNPELASLAGLSTIREIKGFLSIVSTPLLSNFEDLNNLERIGGDFSVINNVALEDFSGLENLDTIFHGLNVEYNPMLTSFGGLEELEYIGCGLIVSENILLNDITALHGRLGLGGTLSIRDNNALQSLAGLDSIYLVDTFPLVSIYIQGNEMLSDISAISDLEIPLSIFSLNIANNPLLGLCGQPNICTFLLEGGNHYIANNSTGCNSSGEVIESCFDGLDHSYVVGKIIGDREQNCTPDPDEPSVANWLITLDHEDHSWVTATDSEGNYWLPVLEGDWTLNVISPSDFWSPCFMDTIIYSAANGDSTLTDFYMQPQGDCSYFEWNLSMPYLRFCDTSSFVIHYCNEGVLPAEDFIVSATLDSFLILVNASIPFTIGADGNYLFEIGNVDVFECGDIVVDVLVDCDSDLTIWDLQCVEVELFSEDLCSPDSLWDGSIISVSGFCENDSIFFNLENIGMGDMSEEAQFRVEIVIDDIVLLHDVDDYQIPAGESTQIAYPVAGSGMRIEADQTSGYPIEGSATAVVPNCEDIANNEILQFFPNTGNGNPFQDIFCTPVSNSFDPNIKTAIPQSWTNFVIDLHYIDKDWPIEYTIQFQNTGNDTAFLVVLKDIISNDLDISTLEVGGASHPFSWEISLSRELSFRFENIQLPDSTTNRAASQGFVSFTIKPRSDISPGKVITNTAAIFFDFNAPILPIGFNIESGNLWLPQVSIYSGVQEMSMKERPFTKIPLFRYLPNFLSTTAFILFILM